MFDLFIETLGLVAWPLALMLAWMAGEFAYRWLGLPRVSSYGLFGFLLGTRQLGFLTGAHVELLALLANFAFGLMLFELGYRINLRWLRLNPWLPVTGMAEALLSFLAVFAVVRHFEVELFSALLLAAISMSTSPASILRVINEARGSGQVTERTLHLSALNCVLAVIAFKLALGYGVLASDGGWLSAVWHSLAVLLVSAALGAFFGALLPPLLAMIGGVERNVTLGFATAILLLTTLTHAFKLSPILATLAFGLMARHRRLTLSAVQRNFGALGDLLTVLLFVFVAAGLDWMQAVAGLPIALAIVGARLLAKTATVTALAPPSGITLRKGLFTGLALTPLSVFAILLLEQNRHLGLLDEVPALAAIVLLLEVAGPLLTRAALLLAGEASRDREV